MPFLLLKKTQFDIIPFVFFLIFIFFFIVLGLVIYFNYWIKKVEEHKNYISKIAYFTLAEQIVSLPYLNCGRIDDKFFCMDYYKIRNFNDLLKEESLNRTIFAKLFKYGQKKVVVKIIFDENKENKCEKLPLSFKNIDCGYYILYSAKRKDAFVFEKKDVLKAPILIRYKDKGEPENDFKYKIGLLVVESFY